MLFLSCTAHCQHPGIIVQPGLFLASFRFLHQCMVSGRSLLRNYCASLLSRKSEGHRQTQPHDGDSTLAKLLIPLLDASRPDPSCHPHGLFAATPLRHLPPTAWESQCGTKHGTNFSQRFVGQFLNPHSTLRVWSLLTSALSYRDSDIGALLKARRLSQVIRHCGPYNIVEY